MNQQEAEAFTARLARIWGVEKEEALQTFLQTGRIFDSRFLIAPGVVLFLSATRFQLIQTGPQDQITGILTCHIENGILRLPAHIPSGNHAGQFEEFSTAWGNTFRRNCWLSGANVVASATEKAEWVQGFKREELEAWSLKF